MNDTLLIKSEYTSFDKYINTLMKKCNCCDIRTDIFAEKIDIKYLMSLLIKLLAIKKHNYKNIIIFEEVKMAKLLKLFVNTKINIFYFNTINKDRLYIDKLKKDFKLWTFDKGDANKFRINLTQQFFFKNIKNKYVDNALYDLYFVGEDKGRYTQLNDIANFLNRNNISYKFNVIRDMNCIYSQDKNSILTDNFIPYENVIECVLSSNIILELVKNKQTGLTYRTMEAIFFDKKLITNNVNIKNEIFYDSKKIYVIKNNNYNGLIDFINSDNITYDKKIKEYYSFENWLKNFVE